MTERAIHKRIGHLPDAEQKVWIGNTAINDRGLCIDPGLIAGAINIGNAAQAALNVSCIRSRMARSRRSARPKR